MRLTRCTTAEKTVAGLAISLTLFISVSGVALGQTVQNISQGYTMKLKMDNRGAFGKISYLLANPPQDSIGLEYPVGQQIEHVYGAGVWIGGFVDTGAVPGARPKVKCVTVGYEGWAGPYYEMFPGNGPGDHWWTANRHQQNTPPDGWSEYWGDLLPYHPISDNDLYCKFDDHHVSVLQHVPMGIDVAFSSYAWDDPYAEAILISEYRIKNVTNRTIDSAYVGFFMDGDVGPINVTNYFLHNFTGYFPGSRTAYISNTSDPGSTPIGLSLVWPPTDTLRRVDSTRTDTVKIIRKFTFQWFPGPNTPPNDGGKYDLMSSGVIKPDEFPSRSDTRFLFAFGPIQMRPDTIVKIAIGLVSGHDLTELTTNANRAVDIYINQKLVIPLIPPSPPLRVTVGFRTVTLDWKWREGDDILFGPAYTNPETLWDTTNQVARWDTSRTNPPYPPGIDPRRGGRTFEAYRIWRSENPDYPATSFTLLKQYDQIGYTDSTRFEYETGLQYTFIDSNLVRGKTYVYSVTSKSIPNIVVQTYRIPRPGLPDSIVVFRVPVEPRESNVRTNAVRVDLPFEVSQSLGKVSVVPNPYRVDKSYTLENGGYEGLGTKWTENERRIKFVNLPQDCTIRVFSLAGDLVRTIVHHGDASHAPQLNMQRGDEDMLLVSESNRALASGIYIFTVESNLGTQTGKFVIIR